RLHSLHRLTGLQDLADEQVVDQDADDTTDEWAEDGDPPVVAEPITVTGQSRLTPTGEVREQAGTEVTCRVDRISGVGAEAQSDGGHDETDHPWPEVVLRGHVAAVDQCSDEHDEDRRADDLVDEGTPHPATEVFSGERGEDREAGYRFGPVGETLGGVECVDR